MKKLIYFCLCFIYYHDNIYVLSNLKFIQKKKKMFWINFFLKNLCWLFIYFHQKIVIIMFLSLFLLCCNHLLPKLLHPFKDFKSNTIRLIIYFNYLFDFVIIVFKLQNWLLWLLLCLYYLFLTCFTVGLEYSKH